jgi:hypothetical protein
MMITIDIELPGGKRARFEREADEFDVMDGIGSVIRKEVQTGQLRAMWQDLAGEVSHWLRYREPTESAAEKTP